MSGSQTSTSARVSRPARRWRWGGLSLNTRWRHWRERALAVEIERRERLAAWERQSEAHARAVLTRPRLS
jgi:hypothetical protein